MYTIILGFVLVGHGLAGEAVVQQPFDTLAQCEQELEETVATAVEILSKAHGEVQVEWAKCVLKSSLEPGKDV